MERHFGYKNSEELSLTETSRKQALPKSSTISGLKYETGTKQGGVVPGSFEGNKGTQTKCKYNTSNDVFSRCKSAHKMATGKSDDQLIQYDNKLELGTSYKLKLGPR